MKDILTVLCLFISISLFAQTQDGPEALMEKPNFSEPVPFQEADKEAMMISSDVLDLLCNNNWAAYKFESFNRGLYFRTLGSFVIDFDDDGTFYQRGTKGTWELVNSKLIKVNYEQGHTVGGYYVITEADEDHIILSKQLTSTNDMRFNYYLCSMKYIEKLVAEGKEFISLNHKF